MTGNHLESRLSTPCDRREDQWPSWATPGSNSGGSGACLLAWRRTRIDLVEFDDIGRDGFSDGPDSLETSMVFGMDDIWMGSFTGRNTITT